MYRKKFLPKLLIASVLVGGVNFVPANVNFNAENLQIVSVAYAKVENVTASGRAIFNFGEDDEQIVNTVKNVAKMRATQAAKEQAGVYVKSQTKTVNGFLTADDISTYTSNNIEILNVTYKKIPVQAHDAQGNDTGEIAFMYEATVTAKIDTAGLNGYIKGDAKTKSEFIKQNKVLQNDISEINKNFDNLNNEVKNKTVEQVKTEIQKIDNQVLTQEKIDEANKLASQGWQFWEQKDYENAILKFNEAIQLNPNNQHLYWQRGCSYEGLKNYNQAISDFTKAIDLYEKKLNSRKFIERFDMMMLSVEYDNRASNYKRVKKYDMAILDYTKEIDLYQKRLTLSIQEILQKSISETEKSKELKEEKEFVNEMIAAQYHRRAECYEELKNYNQAISNYTQAMKFDPKDPYSYLNRGHCYEELKNYEQAISDYTQAIKLDPKDPDAYYYRGDCYEKLGQYEKAGQDFAKAKRLGW